MTDHEAALTEKLAAVKAALTVKHAGSGLKATETWLELERQKIRTALGIIG